MSEISPELDLHDPHRSTGHSREWTPLNSFHNLHHIKPIFVRHAERHDTPILPKHLNFFHNACVIKYFLRLSLCLLGQFGCHQYGFFEHLRCKLWPSGAINAIMEYCSSELPIPAYHSRHPNENLMNIIYRTVKQHCLYQYLWRVFFIWEICIFSLKWNLKLA